ncbi:hypothetical protein [Streptomyces sp. ODS28]|uniref:baeRF2 domain-containing protein n=1 Tax=Streptomyces sp. ODS28 TaxID=3136688 RepID=UPI0031ED5339
MELNELKPVYAHEGPFATVYLEGRSPGEDAAKQIRLRWGTLRERLEAEHAQSAALDAAERALTRAERGEEQANGRVLVTSATDGVVLDSPWDAAMGTGDDAHWSMLPELGAFVREAAHAVRVLLVVAGQEEAELRRLVVAQEHAPAELAREAVSGSAVERPHHIREGALAHRRIQRRADEAVDQNARDIAQAVDRAMAALHPDVLILAGPVQGRTAVREQLSSGPAGILVETDRGGLGRSGAEEALTEEVLRIAGEHSAEAARHAAARVDEGLAYQRAVRGDPDVLKAAETGALDTLVFEDGTQATGEALLLKSAAETDASFALAPAGTEYPDGVGGVLRYAPTGPRG